ncbi:MAG: hypothetical protein H7A05_05570 [Pseudomonadales bacterium]|nr:hypothetical protein [Pseudomonadales bacterium]MCP5344071.1 hypothetical protein [Pseudomonadales bacterium]
MAKLLFKLRHVPDDEAMEVKELLAAHDLEVYETDAGNWGVSLPALWLQDDSRYDEACALLDQYQRERTARVRAEYAELKARGGEPSLLSSLRAHPLRVLFYTGLSASILYLSVSSFFRFQ